LARPLRIKFPGAVYHITSRGNEKIEEAVERQAGSYGKGGDAKKIALTLALCLAAFVNLAIFFNMTVGHLGVAIDLHAFESIEMIFPRFIHNERSQLVNYL